MCADSWYDSSSVDRRWPVGSRNLSVWPGVGLEAEKRPWRCAICIESTGIKRQLPTRLQAYQPEDLRI
ncbi:hypothetical protein PG995_002175 [Apiospora arundinis]|uniref:Uncharacterized protein n=1 Tax=Apiospora arundinis TaxID=335852 RepID=A0ABR2J601_9PEZI